MDESIEQQAQSDTSAGISRRAILLGSAAAAGITTFMKAHGMTGSYPGDQMFYTDNDQRNVLNERVHEGKGTIGVKFFRFGNAPKPALLLVYTIPPGGSEGIHMHQQWDEKLGSYDEFYYILEGSGEMQIAGQTVAVTAGDHVFTPNGVEHGIENTSKEGDLKVYMIAVMR